MPPRLDQFAKGLGVGIHIPKQLKARHLPGLQPTVELTNVGVSQCRQPIGRHRNQAFAGVVKHNRYILARQSRLGFERYPVRRHVGGKQRVASGIGGLVPHIEQSDLIAQQQRTADLRKRDGWRGHGRSWALKAVRWRSLKPSPVRRPSRSEMFMVVADGDHSELKYETLIEITMSLMNPRNSGRR